MNALQPQRARRFGREAMIQPTTAGNPTAVIDSANAVQYINSFTVTGAGTWLLSVTYRALDGIHRVYVARSEDQGRSWTTRIPAYDAHAERGEDFNCEMGQLYPVQGVAAANGERIYQFHIQRRMSNSVRFGRLVYTISEDDGRSWRGPDGPNTVYEVDAPIYDLVGHEWGWHLMAPPLRASWGTMYLPMNCCTDPKLLDDIESEPVFARSENINTASDPAAISFDFFPAPSHGLHVPYIDRPGKSHGMEAQLVELSTGAILAAIRTGNGCVYYATSPDRGTTWTEALPLRQTDDGPALANPNCPNPLTKLQDGRYVLLHCNNDGNAFGAHSVFEHTVVRHPIYASVGAESGANEPGSQPIHWSDPVLITTLDGYEDKHGAPMGNDLSYGLFHEEDGRFYHFYNAKWESIQMNEIPAGLLCGE